MAASGKVPEVFGYLERHYKSITFDEFSITNETTSELDWPDVNTRGSISRNIRVPNPILTSPMRTVTGSEMGIAAAKNGGAGVIHCTNSPDEQKKLATKVKYHLNGIVENPVFAHEDKTVGETQDELDRAGHDFMSLPVVDENNRFVGLMTKTLFEFFKGEDRDTPVKDVMFPAGDVCTASSDIKDDPNAAYEHMKENRVKLLPLLDAERRIDGMYLLDDVMRAVERNPKGYSLDKAGRLITAIAVSTWGQDGIERIEESGKYIDMVVIDTSHGESKHTFNALKSFKEAVKLVKNIREEYGAIDIMVGNVSDESSARALAEAGADAIRVGRGPGGICISREKLGGGTPQASAIYYCSQAVRKVDEKIAICADGGIRGPGHMARALLLGADCIMVGGLVAGTDEAAAPVMKRGDGTEYKEYNGAGSAKELKNSWAARLRYDPSFERPDLSDEDLFVEGVEKELPLRGPVSKQFREMSQGVKKQMCNGGFENIEAFREGGEITLVTAAGMLEGQASS